MNRNKERSGSGRSRDKGESHVQDWGVSLVRGSKAGRDMVRSRREKPWREPRAKTASVNSPSDNHEIEQFFHPRIHISL